MSDVEIDPPRHLSTGRSVAVWLLAALALGAALLMWAVTHGIAREYGSPSIPWLGLLPWALIPGLLAGAATAVLRAGSDRRVWSPWLVGVGVVVLATLVAGALTAAAASARDSDAASGAAVCSDADVALLTSVPGYSADLGDPTGQPDGSCSITLSVQAPASAAADVVVSTMVADGWTAASVPGDDGYPVSRDGMTVNVKRAGDTDNKGITDVTVTIPAG